MKTVFVLLAAACALPVMAQDHADIDKSQIIGNRELPKVLYIVPWKKPVPGDLSGKPLESVLNEAMAPVDKDVFRREVKYETVPDAAAKVSANNATESKSVTGNNSNK